MNDTNTTSDGHGVRGDKRKELQAAAAATAPEPVLSEEDRTERERGDLRYEAGIILAEGPERDDDGTPCADYVVADGLVWALDALEQVEHVAAVRTAHRDRLRDELLPAARELLELTQIALRAGGAPAERTREAMQQYVDAGVEQVNVKQVLGLLSPTWPDGNYCADRIEGGEE